MNRINIAVVLGSQSDLEQVKSSRMVEILDQVSKSYDISIISAHRNPSELTEYCYQAVMVGGAKVLIGVAGMSAALPGAIASIIGKLGTPMPVIGVPLPSTEFPDGQDALLSMVRMPPGMPVAVCGIGKSGLHNAAILACQIVSLTDLKVCDSLNNYISRNTKPIQLGVQLTEGETNGSNP